MPRWLLKLITPRAELLLDVPAPKRKPGPTQRAKDRERMIQKTRELRMELKMPWRI